MNQPINSDTMPMPPEGLRQRVHGAGDIESFLRVGQQCAEDIIAGLKRVGYDISAFESILDFGCGCGRVLRWLLPYLPASRVFGTDIDKEAIAWCGRNLHRISFSVNSGLPPLGYTSNSFALIYAISVFSHLNEEYQFYWLNELRRMTRPKGIVLLSIHGSYYWDKVAPSIAADLQAHGMTFAVSGGWQGVFPDWYQTAFHTEKYVLDTYSYYFDVLEYIQGGMNEAQDLVILQRRQHDDAGLDRELRAYVETSKLRSRILRLEETIEIKNKHIIYLETLLRDIEAGRVLRMLRMFGRR